MPPPVGSVKGRIHSRILIRHVTDVVVDEATSADNGILSKCPECFEWPTSAHLGAPNVGSMWGLTTHSNVQKGLRYKDGHPIT